MARTEAQILIGSVADLPEPRPERGATFTLEPTHDITGVLQSEEQAKRQATIIENDRRRGWDADRTTLREERHDPEQTNENPQLREPDEAQKPLYDRWTGKRLDDEGRAQGHHHSHGRGRSR
jgi:hypothetical protein